MKIQRLSFLIIAYIIVYTSPALAQKQKSPPNIILIMADDMGYSDIGCFGSEISTPNLDALAKGGLRMTQFYNASRCCPTRASLLTGLYPHQAGVGDMVDPRPFPSYQGYLNDRCVTIAEAIKTGGYRTFMAGKWHVGTRPQHWPRQRGFDRFFGLIDGASSYFNLTPYRPNQKLTMALEDEPYIPSNSFYATDAYTDYALKFMTESDGKAPFFLYLAYTAPHWPLHALPADIAKYKGTYKKGWDTLRAERYRRMQALGILDKSTKLSPRDKQVPEWASLSETEKDGWDEKMAVYAAMIDRMDQNIGRLLKELKESGRDKNTVIFFLSDNGGSHESVQGKFTPEVLAASKKPASDPTSFTAYGYPWANVSNTPFRSFKHWEEEGGISTSFIAYYPGVIKGGSLNHQPAHIVDVMATCLDIAGIRYPTAFKNKPLTPLEGLSLLPVFKSETWKGHDAIFFEHEGHRAVRQKDWKIVSGYQDTTWHLYNIKNDRTELTDVTATNPEKVNELVRLYHHWAGRVGVMDLKQLAKER